MNNRLILNQLIGHLFVYCLITSQAQASFCSFLFKPKAPVSRALKWDIFVNTRSLSEYVRLLHHDFKTSLQSLKPHDTWIDLGSGRGVAGEEFVRSFADLSQSPQVVLVTYSAGLLRFVPQLNGKLKMMKKRMWEEIPDSEIPKANLITDFFGVLSYTRDLSFSLQKTFNQLEVGGELYIHSFNPVTSIQINDKHVSLTEFLKTIPGLQVEGRYGVLKITKYQELVEVPKLELTFINESVRPFTRRFRLLTK